MVFCAGLHFPGYNSASFKERAGKKKPVGRGVAVGFRYPVKGAGHSVDEWQSVLAGVRSFAQLLAGTLPAARRRRLLMAVGKWPLGETDGAIFLLAWGRWDPIALLVDERLPGCVEV